MCRFEHSIGGIRIGSDLRFELNSIGWIRIGSESIRNLSEGFEEKFRKDPEISDLESVASKC